MPAPQPIMIDPTKLDASSQASRFLRSYLMARKDFPERYVIERDVVHHHHGRPFILTHDLHRRDMHTQPNELPRYYVAAIPPDEGNPRGNFGQVGAYLGVLHPILDDAVLFVPGSQRVYKKGKCFSVHPEYIEAQENEIKNECDLGREAKKLYPKVMFTATDGEYPTGFYTSMRRARGVTLKEWLEKESSKQKSQIKTHRLMNASLALVQALHLQVSRHGMVHCDIKPENIFICEGPDDDFSVTLVDFGLSTKNLTDPKAPQGTSAYMPPEYPRRVERTYDLKFDVYSMGRVLAEVWGSSGEPWEANLNNEQQNSEKLNALLDGLLSKYHTDANLPKPDDNLKVAIGSALAYDPESRSTSLKLYDDMLMISLNGDERLINARKLGFETRLALDGTKSHEDFMRLLFAALDSLDDNNKIISEFVNGLGWDVLKFSRLDKRPVASKQELADFVRGVFDKRQRAKQIYIDSKTQIQTHLTICEANLAYFSHLKSYVAISDSFKRLDEKCKAVLEKYDQDQFEPDLDEVSFKSEHICHQVASFADLHDLIHLNVMRPSGGAWDFTKEKDEFEREASDKLKLKISSIVDANSGAYDAAFKGLLLSTLCDGSLSFNTKRNKLVMMLAKGKLQREYVELCFAEKQSPVYQLEPYFNLITMLERLNNADIDSALLKSLAQALRGYLNEASDDRSLFLLDRAASSDRLAVVRGLESLIATAHDQDEFIMGLKNLLSNMKTGPLGGSLLKQKLMAVINQYEIRKHAMAKQTKVIDVTNLTPADMKLVSRFLREHKEKGKMVFAGEVYTHHLHEFKFKYDMVLQEDGRFSVVNGLLHESIKGQDQVYGVCGHLSLLGSDACFYHAAPQSEVLRVVGPDVKLAEKNMNKKFKETYATMNQAYDDKISGNYGPLPRVLAKLKTVEPSLTKRPEDHKPQGLFILQAGTSLGNYLKTKGDQLSHHDRVRLTNGLLQAYRVQVIDKQKILTYLDLDNIIVAEGENGEYLFDLIGHGAHDLNAKQLYADGAGQPAFLYPYDLMLQFGAWSVGRVLLDVWDEGHTIERVYNEAYSDLYRNEYDNAFEKKALEKIESKEKSQGLFARTFNRIKSFFVKEPVYPDNKSKIIALLSNRECVKIQRVVEAELSSRVSRELAEKMGEKLKNVIDSVSAPDEIKGALFDLFSGGTQAVAVLKTSCFGSQHFTPRMAEPGVLIQLNKVKAQCNEFLLKANLFINNEDAFKDEPSVWKDLQAYVDKLNQVLLGNSVTETEASYLLSQSQAIEASINMALADAGHFNVENITAGSSYSKMLYECLQAEVDRGVTWFPEGHVIIDKQGCAHRLSHALNVRPTNGNIHYDVLAPLSLKQVNEHSNVYEVVSVLKPGIDDSLMCVKRVGKSQPSRRLVKQNVGADVAVLAQDINGEYETLDKNFKGAFKPKNKTKDTFNQRRQPGVTYTKQIDKDARLPNDESEKLERFLAIVRAYYLQVELNKLQYFDVKPDNLIYHALPNGEAVFSVIDFEPGRWNDYGCPPFNESDEKLRKPVVNGLAKQPLFGLGVILAQLYCGLEVKAIALRTAQDITRLIGTVDALETIPGEVKELIKDLLSLEGNDKIYSLEVLLSKTHKLLIDDENSYQAYHRGCVSRKALVEQVSQEAFIRNIEERCVSMNGEQIQAFIRGLGFASLLKHIDSIESVDDLVQRINAIFAAKDAMVLAWTAKRDALQDLVNAAVIDSGLMNDGQRHAAEFALSEAEAKLQKIHAHYDAECDLDALDDACTRKLGLSMNEFDRLHRRSVNLANTLAPRVQAVLLKGHVNEDNIKKAYAEALTAYTKKKASLPKDHRRRQDIAGLKQIIETTDSDRLDQAVKNYVKGTLTGGLFGKRSLFKGQLASSLLNATKRPVGRA